MPRLMPGIYLKWILEKLDKLPLHLISMDETVDSDINRVLDIVFLLKK